MPDSEFSAMRTAVVQEIIRLALEQYVFPEAGEKIAAHIQRKLEQNAYDSCDDERDLALRLTTDLRSISNDQHWSVVYDPDGAAGQVDPENEADEERLERYWESAQKINYGFARTERMKGNIGYIDLRFFFPSEHAGDTAVAAMNFIANCDALIIDLRRNHGGYPSMDQLLTSYLFDTEPRHIHTLYYRPTDEHQQFWTFPHVSGTRRPDIPVYLLTSRDTASAAEAFAYNLKAMQRAILVGETTAGAAHPVTKKIVQGVFDVRLPYGRPIHPITGSDWEGSGVEPHIAVPAEDALKTAHMKALEMVLEGCQDEGERQSLAWVVDIVASDYSPVVLDEVELSLCAGVYGERDIYLQDGDLFYAHVDIPGAWRLQPLAKTRFRLDEDLLFDFTCNEAGRAVAVRISYADGRPEVVAQRTN